MRPLRQSPVIPHLLIGRPCQRGQKADEQAGQRDFQQLIAVSIPTCWGSGSDTPLPSGHSGEMSWKRSCGKLQQTSQQYSVGSDGLTSFRVLASQNSNDLCWKSMKLSSGKQGKSGKRREERGESEEGG